MADFWDPMNFLTVLLLVFSLLLFIAGVFTAYFGSGKSRKIGAGLLVVGLIIGIVIVYLFSSYGPMNDTVNVMDVIVQTIGVLIAAIIGAAIAVGLFLLAIMKS
jgi:multisubunit Na+/H+ antiporter MnhE subunit